MNKHKTVVIIEAPPGTGRRQEEPAPRPAERSPSLPKGLSTGASGTLNPTGPQPPRARPAAACYLL